MSLSTSIMGLARARTQQDRIRVLQHVLCDKRMNCDQQAELRQLLDEARRAPDPRAGYLRPVLNPADVCKLLVPLRSGTKPVLAPVHEATIEEWLLGWTQESLLREAGVRPPGPLLLSGPTGCGKTTLTAYIASRLEGIRSGVVIEAHNIVDSHLGQTSLKLAEAFEAANKNSGFVVVEEIDALAESRVNSGESADRENNRITVSIMRLMEASGAAIIATTNRPDSLDKALLRRFEYHVSLPVPDAGMRRNILLGLLQVNPPEEMVGLPLTESIPQVSRIRRLMALRKITVAAALAALRAA